MQRVVPDGWFGKVASKIAFCEPMHSVAECLGVCVPTGTTVEHFGAWDVMQQLIT
jgi:hypothetical protein